jgi:3-phenylpropionate/cinnamic acid dioxygenase small subunit
MTVSLQALSDRLEIADLLVAYAHAVDRRRWDTLDDVFTPDAVIDYREMGGIRGTLPEIKEFLATSMEAYVRTHHMVASSRVAVDGDTATAVSMCHNPMVHEVDRTEHVMTCALWYHDTLVRTAHGWRMSSRVTERLAIQNH